MARLADIRLNDIVEVDKKGRKFRADVRDKTGVGLTIRPIDSRITYTTATAREVRRHWRLAGRPKT